jgi:ATP-dependent Lon protease
MSSMTAGWVISGASSQWKNAKPGKVFDTLLNGSYANPVIMVDELDKASAESQYDPLGALYALLERETATAFVDEFVEIPIDASNVVWIATANDESRIPEPILNRLNVYQIAPPDRDGSAKIAQSIYGEIRTGHDWGKAFPERLADDVVEKLAQCSPREMRRILMNGFGNAKLAGRNAIELADLGEGRASRKQRIGF